MRIQVSGELAAEIERISEQEQRDEATVIRELLDRAVTEYRREDAFERYRRGEVSLGTLADRSDLPIRRVLTALRDRDVRFQYSAVSLDEDIPE